MENTVRLLSVYAIPLLIAIIFHEVAHGFVADRLGDPTARYLGRLSFNPVKHIDIFGTILLPAILIISGAGIVFGYAKPVPVDPFKLKDPKRDMVYVSAAGPGVNILLAFISGVAFRLIIFFSPETAAVVARQGLHAQPSGSLQMILVPIALMLVVSTQFNILLALFNLIPVPPLDGGRIVTGLLPQKEAEAYEKVERFGMLIVILLLFLDPFGIMSRFFGPAIQMVSSLFLGI